MTRGYSSSTVTAMYGKDLSWRSRLRRAEERGRRGAARRGAGDPLGDEPRQPDDPALRPGPGRLRHVRGERGPSAPVRPRLRGRERAEPQPLLAAAVRPGR